MKSRRVQWLIVGADRICANGGVANKIGTYALAIAARHHGVRTMVVAPSSTVDMATAEGSGIEIELRDPAELLSFRSEEHTSELQSLMRISYAVFCLKKKHVNNTNTKTRKKTRKKYTTRKKNRNT